jgi:trans-AT polyketide synthase/acyltransferase/oxidoreductase domain-containing protein
MYKGIASEDLVIRMAENQLLGYFGTGGLRLSRIRSAIDMFRSRLTPNQSFGMNLLSNPIKPQLESDTVKLFLSQKIRRIEAAAYTFITSALVHYRIKGINIARDDSIQTPNHILAKIAHPELAKLFMAPPPEKEVQKLLEQKYITSEEAKLSQFIPMSCDLCVEADSGGHTDQGVAYALMPIMTNLRDQIMAHYHYPKRIRIGAAGGLGAPEAIGAAFILGADFVLTGSINQCSVEAGTSDQVKDMLSQADVQDTTIAPAGDMFEMGAKVQVLKKGVFFPARANRLFELYRQHDSIDQIDSKTRRNLEERFFGKSIREVWDETREYYADYAPQQIEEAEQKPKSKMALIFRWYFVRSHRLAQKGNKEGKVNYQIQCGPAMGAFNQWVKGTIRENWRKRHVDEMALLLMEGAADFLNKRLASLSK